MIWDFFKMLGQSRVATVKGRVEGKALGVKAKARAKVTKKFNEAVDKPLNAAKAKAAKALQSPFSRAVEQVQVALKTMDEIPEDGGVGGSDGGVGSVGSVGGVASDMVDVGHDAINASPAMAVGDADGGGIAIATSMGGAAVTATYVWDTTPETQGQTDTSASDTVTGVKVTMPMGALTVSASHVMYNPGGSGTDDTMSGGSLAYAVGGGTLTLGYETSTGTIKATETSGAYSMSLDADTTIKVGYAQADEGATSNSVTEASVTRALGGGASVYAEMKSSSGSGTSTTATTNASTFAIGTSVAF